MIYVTHLLLGIFISFFASFSLGPVNLAVLQSALHGHRARALAIAVGASLIDFFFCLIAVGGVHFIIELAHLKLPDWFPLVIRWGSIPLLVVMGIYTLRKRVKDDPHDRAEVVRAGKQVRSRGIPGGFFLGMTLNGVNPLLIPFWLGLTSFLRGHQWLSDDDLQALFFFAVGAGGGCFLLLFVLALLSKWGKRLLTLRARQRINRGIGIFYLGLAGYILYQALMG
jgi:threonine/homoserine/homoserine lactone efflux protein